MASSEASESSYLDVLLKGEQIIRAVMRKSVDSEKWASKIGNFEKSYLEENEMFQNFTTSGTVVTFLIKH